MKAKKLVEKLKGYMNKSKREQWAKIDSIDSVLKKLAKKQALLEERLKREKDGKAHKHLQKKLDVIVAQQKKGTKLQKELKAENGNNKKKKT